jgi:hypothetical protein
VVQRKKQICGGMGVRKARLLNTIPQGKFGLSAVVQIGIPQVMEMQNSCKIQFVIKNNFLYNFK